LTWSKYTNYNHSQQLPSFFQQSAINSEIVNQEAVMDCPSCCASNPETANFCWKCGSRFDPERLDPEPLGFYASGLPTENSLSVIAAEPVGTVHRRSWKRIAVLCAMAVPLGLGVTKLVYKTWDLSVTGRERHEQAASVAKQQIKSGLLITVVNPSSPADACGLKAGDIVIRYAGLPVKDITSYDAALDAQDPKNLVSFTVFRDGKEIDLKARPGRMGFNYEDWNPVRKLIYEGIQKHNTTGDSLDPVAVLAANAEREGTLSPAQTLIVKIMLIRDRSSIGKEQERSDLLSELFSSYPSIHLAQLANKEFYPLQSYTAAARCYEEHLELFDADDVNIRLNLALTYVRLFDYENAERNVKYVTRNKMRLSAHGVHVVQDILGGIALGRGRNQEALARFLPYMEQGDDEDLLMSLLAAAKMDDLDKFYEIRDRAAEVAPKSLKNCAFLVDSLNAYLLAARGKNDKAAALVLRHGSAQCVVDTAGAYWGIMPEAADIAPRLEKLLQTP